MKREDLGNGYFVYTDKDNTFSADSLLLADFAPTGDTAVDLCSGCGAVAMLLCKKGYKAVTAVEIDGEAVALLTWAAADTHAPLTAVQEDVRHFMGQYPTVVCNPPYFKEGRSPYPRRNEIRSECLLSPDDLVKAAYRLLTPHGVFCFCHREERREELTEKFRAAGLFLRRLCLVRDREDKPPYLFLAEWGKTQTETRVTEFVLRDRDGDETAAYRHVCGQDETKKEE